MNRLLDVTDLEFDRAPEHEIARGLLGWCRFTLGGEVAVDSVQVRRTRDGRLELSYPGRRSRTGELHRYVTPLTDTARAEIEGQVFAEMRRRGGAA